MSKLFINTINQNGGDLTKSDTVTILNTISKHINKKFKILEYTFGIKMKLQPLPIDNWVGLPKNIAITTMAHVNGPIKGTIPIQTTVPISLPVPSVTPITAGIPITPFGPILGIPGLAVNQFGNFSSIEDKINKAKKFLEIYQLANSQLNDLIEGKITKDKVDTQYFDFVDLDEPEPIEGLFDKINAPFVSGYSKL